MNAKELIEGVKEFPDMDCFNAPCEDCILHTKVLINENDDSYDVCDLLMQMSDALKEAENERA
jgi:hypothetical protein